MALRVRDGVQLFSDEVGRGSPPLLLVHGLMCDHRFWAPQVAHFSKKHRVVAVDLRGHGASDAAAGTYTMDLLADDLAWLCGEVHLEEPVVVGHSLGGVVALQLAARHVARAAVLLDSPIIPLESTRAMVQHHAAALRGSQWQAAQHTLTEWCFRPESDPMVRAWVFERAGAPQHVVASLFEDLFKCDTAAAAAACTVPVMYVSAADVHVDLVRFRELCPQLMTGQTVGSGHYHQLEVPEQINAMIDRFLAMHFSENSA
jgi:pimeloyl-ACP methyl ester carboxylesterase